MEKTVTLRFYDVRRASADRPQMADLLDLIGNKPMAEREKRITVEDILVRLENYESNDDFCSGQFIRSQSGNLPGRMLPEQTDSLPFAEPLGHGIAFRYRKRDGLLAIEYNPRILSPSRVLEYLYAHEARAEYTIRPRFRDDAWARFEALPVRKVEVAIAGHPNAGDIDNEESAIWHDVARIKERYGADTVRIQVAMGHRKGALSEGVKAFAREAFRRNDAGEDELLPVSWTPR